MGWRDILDREIEFLNNSPYHLTDHDKAGVIRRAAKRLSSPPNDHELEDYLAEKGLTAPA